MTSARNKTDEATGQGSKAPPKSRLASHIEKIAARNSSHALRQAEIEAAQKELYDDSNAVLTPEIEAEATPEQKSLFQGESSQDRVDRAVDSMIDLASFASSQQLQVSNKYPTLLARLPIFPAATREEQKDMLDKDGAFVMDTPFGKFRRAGMYLDPHDEDVLIALFRLRRLSLTAQQNKLPVQASNAYVNRDKSSEHRVHLTVATFAQINEEMSKDAGKGRKNKKSYGGRNNTELRESINRINSAVLEIQVKSHDLYFGKMKAGTSIKMVDIDWHEYESHGVVFAQFHPVIVGWLESSYTYINWPMRKQLRSRVDKALHRFLSTQGPLYKTDLMKLADQLGIPKNFKGGKSERRKTMERSLKRLVKVGFLEAYEITGTGRNQPWRLTVLRTKKPD